MRASMRAQRIGQLVGMLSSKIFDDANRMGGLEIHYARPFPSACAGANWAADAAPRPLPARSFLDFVNNDLFQDPEDIILTAARMGAASGALGVRGCLINYMKNGTYPQVITSSTKRDFNRSADRHCWWISTSRFCVDLQKRR